MSELLAGRYEVIRPLGTGGMADVLLVRDTREGRECALKRLHLTDPEAVARLREEFAALARIDHPNIVRVYDYGTLEDGAPYFTMEYLKGKPLDEALSPGDVPGVLRALRDILAGLAALHSAGLVHCDLKASNLLVVEGEGGVRILDFGLTGRLTDASGERVRGTPGYVAPEVLDGAKYSRESDYYALGATLYRVLTGRAAFPGRDAAAILAAQRTRRPSVLPLRSAGVPRALEATLLGLVDADPNGRPQAFEALQRLVREHTTAGAMDLRTGVYRGRGSFVGRDAERKRLLHHLLRADTHAAVIAGPIGSGRTRLSREIAIEAELAGWGVHWLDVDTQAPSDWSDAAKGRSALLILEDADLWSPEALAALPLGQLTPPVAVLATVLGSNLRGPWRSSLLRLPADPAWMDVALGPFTDEDTAALFRSRGAASEQNELIEITVASVGRNPGALHDAIDILGAHIAAEHTSAGWRLEPRLARQALDEQRAPSDPENWNTLPPVLQQVALSLAGWPESPSTAEIVDWTGLTSEIVDSALRDLEWAGLSERTTTGWRIVPKHRADWIFDFAIERPIRERMISALELRVANLERGDQAAASLLMAMLGRHQLALGKRDIAMQSLREAIRIGGHETAPHLRKAAAGLERAIPSSGLEAGRAFAELGTLWERLDSPILAIDCYAKAVAALPESEWSLAADWTLRRASLLDDLGKFNEALSVLEAFSESSAQLHADTIRNPERTLALARLASHKGRLYQMQARRTEARSAYELALSMLPPNAHGELAVAQNRLATLLYLSGARDEGIQLTSKAAVHAEAHGDPDILAQVLHSQVLWARNEDRVEDEDRLFAQAIALGRGRSRREQYSKILASRATALSNRARWAEFEVVASEVEALARESHNTHLLLQTMASRATSAMRRGHVKQQRDIEGVERAWLASVVHSEAKLHHLTHKAQRLLLEGREAAAVKLSRKLLRQARTDLLPRYEQHARLQLGLLAFRAADLRRARSRLGEVLRDMHTEPYILHGAILGLARIARREGDRIRLDDLRALVADHPKQALWWDPLRVELEAIDASLGLRAADAAPLFDQAIAHYARHDLRPHEMETATEAGLALAEMGEAGQAVRYLRHAHGISESLGLEIQAGRLADLILDQTSSAEASEANAPVTSEEPDTLVRVAGVLNSLLDFPLLLSRSLELVCARVRAERGLVLLTDGDGGGLRAVAQFGGVDAESRDKALEVSKTVVRQVTESGSIFRSDDASNDPRLGSTLSILDMSVRALLCTPLRIKNEIIGTIYVENRDAITHFSDRDATLVDAFGNLVAVTIQNSRLHDELRQSRDRVIGQNLSLRREVVARYSRPNIVGQSAEIERVLGEVERVAVSRGSVLITGESGTGKELVAKTIHFASQRVDHPFLSLNCAALPADLIESELFGIEDHVATGVRGRPGIFERADGGTLFLDEIGDMPLSLQAKLLRVLQEREFSRLGGSRVVRVDIRLIAATNQDLRQLIRDGRFREDLYFRVHTLPIHIAPLRERRVDIPILANHFLHRFCEENGLPIPRISADFTATILGYAWPGNVRELQNYIERSVVMSRGPILEPVVLPTEDDPGAAIPASGDAMPNSTFHDGARPERLKEALEDAERRWILQTLAQFDGNQRKAARALGIVEPTLRYRMGRLGIAAGSKTTAPKKRPSSKH